MKTFYLDRACVRAASLAVAFSLASAAYLTAQDKPRVVCADGFVATSVAICNASHHGVAPTTIGASSATVTDNPFRAATAGLPDAGGTSSKPPVVLTKETGSASPTIWQNAVTGESLDTATKSGGITKGAGGTAPKQPVVLTKEIAPASPTIWQRAVTGESLDTATKSGGITKSAGTELNAFKMGSPAAVDTPSTKPKGKRPRQPVIVP